MVGRLSCCMGVFILSCYNVLIFLLICCFVILWVISVCGCLICWSMRVWLR